MGTAINRPVAKNFQVGVLSLRVLGLGESEVRRVEGDGGLPLRTSSGVRGVL